MIQCPAHSTLVDGNCICHNGYVKQGQLCVPFGDTCPPNKIDNGFGQCICNKGYYEDANGNCIFGEPCPVYSSRNSFGECVCNPGYFSTSSGTCSRCQEGAFWNGTSCVFVCGVYAEHVNGQCQCKDGYGNLNGKCSICPSNFFLHQGYCVTCPINT